MKLLYITEDRFPPFRVDVVELFARQMPARGHTIDWLMQRGPECLDLPSPTQWLGSQVFLTPRSRKSGLMGRILNNILGIVGDVMIIPVAIRGRYDVIQVRDKFLAGFLGWFAARLTGAKFVHWMSYPFPESKLYEVQHKLVPYRHLVRVKAICTYAMLYGFNLRVADHIFVQSAQMKADVAAKGINPSKMSPVPMGIRADQVKAPGMKTPALNVQAPMLVHLGVIQKIRSSDMLVRVLALVRKRYPAASLTYVGEGQQPADRQAVELVAQQLDLASAVTITGFLPMAEAWKHVARADICFSPFYPTPVLLSTSPTKLVEYLAMGKCVVANEHPEQQQVLRDSGVGQCVPWDEQAFADEVCRLLDEPVAACEAASKGPTWVRQHRIYDVIADRVEAEYVRLLAP